MELNNINQYSINENVPQSNYPNQLYQNNYLKSMHKIILFKILKKWMN